MNEEGNILLLRNSEADQLKMNGISNELQKLLFNTNNMNKKELFDTIQNYVEDKVPNVTDEKINRKLLSGLTHTVKWHAIDPDVSQVNEPDNDFQ